MGRWRAVLGLSDALVLRAGVAMIECMRLIIGEVGTREREREGLKIEVVQGQTTAARKQEQMSCSHAEDPVVKELGEA